MPMSAFMIGLPLIRMLPGRRPGPTVICLCRRSLRNTAGGTARAGGSPPGGSCAMHPGIIA